MWAALGPLAFESTNNKPVCCTKTTSSVSQQNYEETSAAVFCHTTVGGWVFRINLDQPKPLLNYLHKTHQQIPMEPGKAQKGKNNRIQNCSLKSSWPSYEASCNWPSCCHSCLDDFVTLVWVMNREMGLHASWTRVGWWVMIVTGSNGFQHGATALFWLLFGWFRACGHGPKASCVTHYFSLFEAKNPVFVWKTLVKWMMEEIQWLHVFISACIVHIASAT